MRAAELLTCCQTDSPPGHLQPGRSEGVESWKGRVGGVMGAMRGGVMEGMRGWSHGRGQKNELG